MELQRSGFYALHKQQNLDTGHSQKSSHIISNGVQPDCRVVSTVDRSSLLVRHALLKSPRCMT